jgi:hypothetical protein
MYIIYLALTRQTSAPGADTVTNAMIVDNAINSEHYIDGSIDLAHMSVNSIDSDQYVDASIDNAHLADDAVGVDELSATGTASSSTFLRGDNAWAAAGGGKILQVVSTTKTDTFYTATTSSWVDITGLSATITPASTSSKVLISYNVMLDNASSSYGLALRMMRGSTPINVGGASGSRSPASTASDSYAWGDLTWGFNASTFLDSPSTTSATTFKIQGHGSSAFYINRNHADTDTLAFYRCTSSITLMEIGA